MHLYNAFREEKASDSEAMLKFPYVLSLTSKYFSVLESREVEESEEEGDNEDSDDVRKSVTEKEAVDTTDDATKDGDEERGSVTENETVPVINEIVEARQLFVKKHYRLDMVKKIVFKKSDKERIKIGIETAAHGSELEFVEYLVKEAEEFIKVLTNNVRLISNRPAAK